MSSQGAGTPVPSPAPPALALAPPPTEIKQEESAVTSAVTAATAVATTAIENATESANLQPPVATETLALPSTAVTPTSHTPVPAAELTKKDYDVMARIVKYLTEYKDEEYRPPPRWDWILPANTVQW